MERQHASASLMGYLPSLDGWRAIAVVCVILSHESLHSLGPLSTLLFQQYGHFGVDLFFAISGILICSRLLDEEKLQHAIHMKAFYIRRACRILPAALAFLIAVAVLHLCGVVPLHWLGWLASVLFFRNYLPVSNIDWFTSHFWSLSLEEHFYLFLPAFLLLIPKHRVRILLSMIALLAVWRLCAFHLLPEISNEYRTDTRILAILIPATIAVLFYQPANRERLTRFIRFWPIFLIAVALIIGRQLLRHYGTKIDTAHLHFAIGDKLAGVFTTATILPVFLSLMLLATALHPGDILSRLLESRPLRFLGKMSYSLYLWQMLFFGGEHLTPETTTVLTTLPFWIRAAATLCCACCSYQLLERPMVRLGHRLAPPATPGRPGEGNTKPVLLREQA